MNQIAEVGLEVHNNVRKRNNLPELKLCPTMCADAQQHSDYLVATQSFQPTTLGKYGCNLAQSVRRDKAEAVQESIKRVCGSSNSFDFCNPQVANMGIGVTLNQDTDRWIIVCFYDAPGMRGGLRGGS